MAKEGRDGSPSRPGCSGSRVGRPRLSSVALAKEGRGRRAVCRPGLDPRRDSGGGSQYPIFNNQSSTFNGQGAAGIDHPFSRGDAEGAEDVPPGSNPGRGRAAERGGFIVCRIAPLHSKTSFHRTDPFIDPFMFSCLVGSFGARWAFGGPGCGLRRQRMPKNGSQRGWKRGKRAGNYENAPKTRKMERKRAKTRGDCPRSDIRGRRSGKPQSVSIRVHPWLGFGLICPRSEVRGRRSEKVYLREFASICGRFSAGRGLRRQRMLKNGSQRAWAG